MQELITKLDPREFTRIFFADQSSYKRLTNKVKNDNSYLFTLMLAKRYPILALQLSNVMNHQLIDLYHKKLTAAYKNKIPQWVFTPLKKKQEQVNSQNGKQSDELSKISEETIETYKTIYKIDSKTFKFILEDSYDELIKDLKKLEIELHSEKFVAKKVSK